MNPSETMNANHPVKRLVWSFVLTVGLAAGVLQQANAHEQGHRYPAHRYHYAVPDRHYRFPRWLRHDTAFKRWYWRSGNDRIRRFRHLGWHRVYDIYLRDRRYHKKRRYWYGDAYYDHRRGYRKDRRYRHRH